MVYYYYPVAGGSALLVVSTGNITNAELEALFVPNIPAIVAALQTNSYIELTRTTLIIRA